MRGKNRKELPEKVAKQYDNFFENALNISIGTSESLFEMLSEVEMKILRWRYIEKLTLTQIASKLGKSKQAVWEQERRAFKKLQDGLMRLRISSR